MMNNEWDEMATFWDTHEDVIQYSKCAFKSLNNSIDIRDKKVLDFGCGSGLLTKMISLEAKEVIAIDSSEAMILALENKRVPNITSYCVELSDEFINQNNDALANFDVIVTSSVCAFIKDYPKLLAMFKKLLKPGGVLVQWDWLISEYKLDEGFDIDTVQIAFEKNGFTDYNVDCDFSLNHQKVLKAVAVKPHI